jgi:hypothetical protein
VSVAKSQKQKIELWIATAFEQYAAKCEIVREVGVSLATEVRRYKGEFSRIVLSSEEVELRNDLYNLMNRGCPALDIVELMLVCTSGIQRTISYGLDEVGITDNVLRRLKQNLVWTAEVLDVLNDPILLGPLDTLAERFPRKRDERSARRSIEAVPDALRTLAAVLENYPPAHESEPMIKALAENEFFVYLYLLLRNFGEGYPTLSRLLTTMRRVQRTVSPDAEYLHKFISIRIVSGKRKGKINDPFTEGALQYRLYRFNRDFPIVVQQMHTLVSHYTSDGYTKYRQHGQTMLEFIARLQQKEKTREGPEARAEHLGKALELSEQQRLKVLSICYEEEKRIGEALVTIFPRRTAALFPAALSSRDMDSKVRQISLSAVDQVKRVLNPEQEKKFDGILQSEEKKIEGMLRSLKRQHQRSSR